MRAVAGEGVEVRSLEPVLAFEKAHGVVAVIVGEDEDDVSGLGPAGGGLSGCGSAGERAAEE